MAEFETIQVTNPTKDDFSVRFNGEMYSLPAGATTSYPKFLAFHMSKHLSNKMMEKEAQKLRIEFKESVYVPQESALMNHDNPSRRIAFYDILGSKARVEECVNAIPFKAFIGEMSVYDAHVSKKEAKSVPPTSPSTKDEPKK